MGNFKPIYIHTMVSVNRQAIYILLAISVVLLSATLYLTYDRYNMVIEDYDAVNHTDEVLREIYNAQGKLFETESNVRAFMLVRTLKQIPQVSTDEVQVNLILDNLERVTSDNPRHKQVLSEIRPLVNERFKIWSYITYNLYNLSSDQQDSLMLRTATASDQLNRYWRTMKKTENDLMEQRIVRRDKSLDTSPKFLAAASFVSLIIIGVMFVLLQFQLKATEELTIEMERKNVELNRSNKELEQFAYVASHDLQEPLRKLRSFSERLLVKEKNNLSEDGKQIVGKLDGFAQKMQRLIDDLLTFSRVVNTKFEMKDVDLNKVLNDCRNNLSDTIIKTGTTINSNPLPRISGYETQLNQLFQNLLSNAIKYSRPDTNPEVNIYASIIDARNVRGLRPNDRTKQFHKIDISDNGIGFDNQYAEKIFTIFQRLHGKSEYEGTGIGLAISKAVMNNHNGYIVAEGLEGKGAIFTLYFPLV